MGGGGLDGGGGSGADGTLPGVPAGARAGPGVGEDPGAGTGPGVGEDPGAGTGPGVGEGHAFPKSGHVAPEKYTPKTVPKATKQQHTTITTMTLVFIVIYSGF